MTPIVDKKRLRELHRRLMDEIRREAVETRFYTGRETFSDSVMAAMDAVDRSQFVPEDDIPYAYVNRPLPIGHGQTISQPYIVALMTDLLAPGPGQKILEIGTGSGYQAAVLAQLADEVFSIETVPDLAKTVTERLRKLGCDNIHVRHGDGHEGWPEEAPFDGIMVTAAPETVPPALIEQLAPGGRLIIPIGRVFESQTLTLCIKDPETGKTRCDSVLPVAFVPMVKRPTPN